MKLLNHLQDQLSALSPAGIKELYLRTRKANAKSRALPNFIIIGAQKSGSTSLFKYLRQHRRIIGSVPKEIFYFNEHYAKGPLWYRRHFPKHQFLMKIQAITGEATTMYLCSEDAPARVAALLPDVKLIAVLREPAARAISHYKHRCHTGRETRPIDAVFSKDTIARWSRGDSLSEADTIYFDRGLYARQLKCWLQYFSREQLLVVQAEKMFAEPAATVAKVQAFLGVDLVPPRDTKAFKVSTQKILKPSHIDELEQAYHPHNQALVELGFRVGGDWG